MDPEPRQEESETQTPLPGAGTPPLPWSWVVGIPLAIMIAVIVLLVLHAGLRAAQKEELEAEDARLTLALEEAWARLTGRGEPLSSAEAAPPPLPVEKNGAPLLVQAIKELEKNQDLPDAEDVWTWEAEWEWDVASFGKDLPMAEKLVALNADVYALVEEALDKPRFRFDLRYEEGQSMEIGPIFGMHDLLSLLNLRAWVRAARGRGEEALQDVERELLLGRAVVSIGPLIAVIVSASFQIYSKSTLEYVLQLTTAPVDALSEINRGLISSEVEWDLKKALLNERANVISLYQDQLKEIGRTQKEAEKALSENVRMKRELLVCLDEFRRLLEAAGKSYLEIQEGHVTRGDAAGESTPAFILLPDLYSIFEMRARTITHLRMARIACTIASQRDPDGNLPENIENIVAKGPKDHFTQKPYLVDVGPKGAVIHSPGPDGVNRNPVPDPDRIKELELEDDWDDICFFLARTVPPACKDAEKMKGKIKDGQALDSGRGK